MIPAVVPSSPSPSCLSADSDEGMEAELREEEMEQEEEKEADMAAVEATAAAVQAAAVQPQQPPPQSQPLSHSQAETAAAPAAAAAEAPDEKAGVERTASVGKRAKESDEEGTSPGSGEEAQWVQYEQEVDAKRRKLSVAQKRRARRKAGRQLPEEAWAEEWAERWAAFSALPQQQDGLPEPSEQRAWTERWTAFAAVCGLPSTGLFRFRSLEDGSGPLIISLATGLPATTPPPPSSPLSSLSTLL